MRADSKKTAGNSGPACTGEMPVILGDASRRHDKHHSGNLMSEGAWPVGGRVNFSP
jgi:hypothetical protein